MNKKKIFIIIAVLIIILIPIIGIGANKIRRKMNGKMVVMQGEDISDIEDGEKLILAAPIEDENSGREADLEMKQAYEENMYSENNIAKPSIQKYSAEEIEEQKQYEKEQEELNVKEQEVLNVLYKFYEKNYVDNLANECRENPYSLDHNTYSEQIEELIEITIKAIEQSEVENDKNVLRNFLKMGDLSGIKNENLKNKLRNLGIDV
ncbi:MAG TPA: hypothetical protein IAD08_02725 [Candidatus Scatovivens faecipullorum]|nr:hypothetical protein [Candidatus Scatovivens faecipullorum]